VSEQPQRSLFQQRLRECREKRDLSKQELSQLCGLSINQISRYESGTQDPSLTVIKKIAEILGVSIDYLAGVASEPTGEVSIDNLSIFEREIIETFRREGWAGIGHLSLDRLAKN
jgi:transcriptional regulator with XRE-family HTH domain